MLKSNSKSLYTQYKKETTETRKKTNKSSF